MGNELAEVTMRDCRDIRPGDIIIRQLGGLVDMELVVTSVDDHYIYVGSRDDGYKFDRDTGAEVDEDLEWGPGYGVSGSFITRWRRP